MFRGIRRATALCWLAAVAACLGSVPAEALPQDRSRWLYVRSPNFTLISEAGRNRTVRMAGDLERLRDVLASTSVGMRVQSSLPTTIYVFRDAASFRPYNLNPNGEPRNWSGYFIGSRDGNYVALDASVAAESLGIVYHEYLHDFLRNNLPRAPLWLNEGLAEFYSSFEVRAGRAEIGRPVERHLDWLARHSLIPLEELFELEADSPDYNEGARQGTIYAQSWALTHYLLSHPDRRPHVGEFLGLLNHGSPSGDAFAAAFDIDLDTAERELRQYVRQTSYSYYKYTPQEQLDAGTVFAVPLDRPTLLYRLGDLLAHHPSFQHEAAEEHLQAALALDEDHPEALAAMALLMLQDDRADAAETYVRRALTRRPKDARFLALHGRVLFRKYEALAAPGAMRPRTAPTAVLQARRELRRSLELRPDDYSTLAVLGRTYLAAREDPLPGIDALSRAAEGLPSRADIPLDLITLLARAGHKENAWEVLDRALRPRGDGELIRTAEAIVIEPDLLEAARLYSLGKPEAAEEVMRRAASEVRDPGLKLTLLTELVTLSSDGPSTRSIQLFNEAVAAAKAGDMETAAGRFESLLEQAQQPDLRAAAQTHLTEIRRTLDHNRMVESFNQALLEAKYGNRREALNMLEELLRSKPERELRWQAERLLRDLRTTLER